MSCEHGQTLRLEKKQIEEMCESAIGVNVHWSRSASEYLRDMALRSPAVTEGCVVPMELVQELNMRVPSRPKAITYEMGISILNFVQDRLLPAMLSSAPPAPPAAAGWVSVQKEIDRAKHHNVLQVWNDCMAAHETLEMTWPKLVSAMEVKHGTD